MGIWTCVQGHHIQGGNHVGPKECFQIVWESTNACWVHQPNTAQWPRGSQVRASRRDILLDWIRLWCFIMLSYRTSTYTKHTERPQYKTQLLSNLLFFQMPSELKHYKFKHLRVACQLYWLIACLSGSEALLCLCLTELIVIITG